MDNTKININGNEYTKAELRKRPNKELHLEVLLAVSDIQTDFKVIKEHIKTQDDANNERFKLHRALIISVIFGLLASLAGVTISLIKLFV